MNCFIFRFDKQQKEKARQEALIEQLSTKIYNEEVRLRFSNVPRECSQKGCNVQSRWDTFTKRFQQHRLIQHALFIIVE